MADAKRSVGRPRRYAKYEQFEASLPDGMTKRPAYCDGIGIFKGERPTPPSGSRSGFRAVRPTGVAQSRPGGRSNVSSASGRLGSGHS